ncbi:SET domain-containing protein [Daldinia decipiens]|uniref:SET domain-containing protein n=1 Tax=Daldinia decipiens TaxID=326647 RepID=UPI0020C365C2|nr:SET domain-containing protein [Daldinia decipiens]KAI1658908.1 SET domain-containing protein [Daldinia decipiens]
MAPREFEMLNSVEVKASEGKGLGLFAKANIPANTIVSRESPIIYGSPRIRSRSYEEKVRVFCEAYSSASVSQRGQLDNHAWNPEQHEQHKDLYNHFDKWLKDLMERSRIYEPEVPRTEPVLALIKAYSIFWINASGTPDNGAAVYSTFARSNHSCRPNTTWRYIGDRPYELELVTECDIPAGEEITVAYDNLSRLKLDDRRRVLSNWGFTCQCERCTEEEYAMGRLG